MNALFRRSASIAPAAARQTLVALLRLIPAESFSSSSISPLRHFNGSPAPAKSAAVDVRRRGFHFARTLEFRASDVARSGLAMEERVYEGSYNPEAKAAGDEGLEIAKLGIAPEIVMRLASKGITKLFPIQRAVLEPAMQGHDMIGRAKTGTGKTLAFGIPIMDKIIKYNEKNGHGRNPRALVLAPTRELAKQVEKEFKESSSLATICVYGGVPIQTQMSTLNYGVDVVVGTPGRIIDLINRGAINLKEVQFLVLDEADQMLAVGFQEAVEIILQRLPQNRQSMMFSATMPSWIINLTKNYLKNPVTVDLVGDDNQKLAEGITLYSVATDSYRKPHLLAPLIQEHAKGGKCIIFTQTKRDADRLSYGMSRSFTCEALHGDISQFQRERTLSGFRDGRFNILVATDVAARGLDVPNVDLVIHYELPNTSELFVHRSGRTGRAGKTGTSILMYTDMQSQAIRDIERDVGCIFTELPKIEVEVGSDNAFAGLGGGSFVGGRMGGGGSGYNRGGGGSYGSNYGGFNRYAGGGGGGGGYGSGPGNFNRGGGSGYGAGSGYGSGGGGYGAGSGYPSSGGGYGAGSGYQSGGGGYGAGSGYQSGGGGYGAGSGYQSGGSYGTGTGYQSGGSYGAGSGYQSGGGGYGAGSGYGSGRTGGFGNSGSGNFGGFGNSDSNRYSGFSSGKSDGDSRFDKF